MKKFQLFSYCSLTFFKDLKYPFDTVSGQDGLVCDDVGWWSGFNKGRYGIYDVDIGLVDILQVTVSNNHVDP